MFFIYASGMTNKSLQNYDKLVDLIYSTPKNSGLWLDLLQALEDFNHENNGCHENIDKNLAKHIQRSCDMMDSQQNLQQENMLLHMMINRFPIGVIVVQTNAKVVAINQRAEALLQKSATLSICQGVLQTYNKTHTKTLIQHLQIQGETREKYAGSPMRIKSKGEKPVSLWISPTYVQQHQAPVIFIYITSSELCFSVSSDMLIKYYQLTPSEANLAQNLCSEHHRLQDAADACEISYETARTYLKKIFHKTNTHSQPELIKLLLTYPAALVEKEQETKSFFAINKTPSKLYIHLHDGRKLGYVEYGNPKGEPVIFCHSLIHMDDQMFHDPSMQNRINDRIIVPKRPGFLNSSKKQAYSLQNHAQDVIQLVDQLGIQHFKVMGHSNSSGYAAAIAHDYPERVHKLLLISPFVPPNMDDLTCLQTNDKLMYMFGKYMPKMLLQQVAHITLKSIYKNPETLAQNNFDHFSESERQFCSSQPLLDYVKQWIQTSYPDRVSAITYDLFVRLRDWGFKPEHIRVPTEVWYAPDDSTVSPHSVRKLEEALPDCKSQRLASGGHYIFFTHFDEITMFF